MINKQILIGNLGADPETHNFDGGGQVTNITVATSRRWKDKQSGEQKEETEWFRVVFYNKLAEIAQKYLKKGSQVYVEGRTKTRKWTDDKGIERYTSEVIAETMKMLRQKREGTHSQNKPPIEQPPEPDDDYFNDEIPF